MQCFNCRLVSVDSEEKTVVLQNIQNDSSFKGAYFMSLFRALYLNNVRSRKQRFEICKEVFVTIPEVIYTKKYFYLLDELSNGINGLKASGLMSYWNAQEDKKIDNENSLKSLTLNDYKGCFFVLFSGFVIGLVLFLIEVLFKIVERCK